MTFLTMTWKRALGFLTGLTCVVGGMCHGYLAHPAARNVQRNSNYCPHCLNGPEVCGDPRGRHDHEAFGRFASSPRIARTYASGGLLRARVVITANHRGRWSLGLCALKDSSLQTERATLSRSKCFKKLKLANGGGTYVYLSSSASASSATFKLPRGVRCSRCLLRWHYETGNSCTPRGTPRQYANPGLETCGTRRAPAMETFTNCADIRIR